MSWWFFYFLKKNSWRCVVYSNYSPSLWYFIDNKAVGMKVAVERVSADKIKEKFNKLKNKGSS